MVYGVVGQQIPLLQLNLIKGIIAIALLFATILISGDLAVNLSPLPVFFLLLSGVIGIGWGDTVYLAAINYLGARKMLLQSNRSRLGNPCSIWLS